MVLILYLSLPACRCHLSLKLLQITDTHLFADPSSGRLKGVNTYESLESVLELASCEKDLDLAVLSGDLSQDETIESYGHLGELMTRLPCPVFYIPGNHDDTGLMHEPLTRSGRIRQSRSFARGAWRLVFLDSRLEGRCEGALSDAELEALSRELGETEQPNIMIFLHHNPVNIRPERHDPMMLQDADRFFALLDTCKRVKAVVWGHVHEEFESRRKNVRLYASPSSCVQFRATATGLTIDERAAGYRVFELGDDGGIETVVRRLPAPPPGLQLIDGDL